MKKTLFILALVLMLTMSLLSVYADGSQSIISKVTGISDSEIAELRAQGVGYGQLIPASIIAKRLNIPVKEVVELKKSGKTYYEIANEKGIKIEDFKNDVLQKRNAYIDEAVKAGIISEEQAKFAKERIKLNISNCDGSGNMKGQSCAGMGIGEGRKIGVGKGNGFRGGCRIFANPANSQ